jgi:hypothetical protein
MAIVGAGDLKRMSMAVSEWSKDRVKGVYADRQFKVVDRHAVVGAMTTPTVTELPRRREPVSADTFLGDLALGEQRLYGDTRTASGPHLEPQACQLELFGWGVGLQHGCS